MFSVVPFPKLWTNYSVKEQFIFPKHLVVYWAEVHAQIFISRRKHIGCINILEHRMEKLFIQYQAISVDAAMLLSVAYS